VSSDGSMLYVAAGKVSDVSKHVSVQGDDSVFGIDSMNCCSTSGYGTFE
jgi:hypothetical protein